MHMSLRKLDIRKVSKYLLTLPLVIIIAACGTPAAITIRNIRDATAAPVQELASPTQQVTNRATQIIQQPTLTPTIQGMEGMVAESTTSVTTVGTAAASVASASGTDFVLIWVLFGTPTSTPVRTQAGLSATSAADTGTAIGAGFTKVPPTAAANTPVPTATLALTAMPHQTTVAAQTGDAQPGQAENGKMVFTITGGCSACHDVANGITIVGPSLKGVASRAASRKPGVSAADYLHESLVSPNAYVVQGFPQGVMPQNLSQVLTPQQINDVVAYLLTLK